MGTHALHWIDDSLEELDRQHLRRTLRERESAQQATIQLAGRRLVNFSANDYLGLAADPRLSAAARLALESLGWGSGASPLISGRATSHAQLEAALAGFEGTAAALLFPSGYAANVGTITAIAGRDDAIYSDAKNHASIIDGCRLSGAHVFVYRHTDLDDLRGLLAGSTSFRRRLIVTDTVFSMDGDLAPMTELADLAQQHDAMLMADEAHATGVFGTLGRGICELLGVEDHVDIRVGTLSKAFGSIGGFVAGSQSLVDWLTNRARPYVFSTAYPAACAAASLAALRVVEEEPDRRQILHDNASWLREQLRGVGCNTGNCASQIIPIYIGAPDRTMELAAHLQSAGYLVPGIRPPSVPAGESLLRISLCYGHARESLEAFVELLREFT